VPVGQNLDQTPWIPALQWSPPRVPPNQQEVKGSFSEIDLEKAVNSKGNLDGKAAEMQTTSIYRKV